MQHPPVIDQPTAPQPTEPSPRKRPKLRIVSLSTVGLTILIIMLIAALNKVTNTNVPTASSSTTKPDTSPSTKPTTFPFEDVESLLAALAINGAPCTAVSFVNGSLPGSVNPYADCSGVSQGDTAISMFTSHASALAYAHAQITTGKGLATPTAEVIGPNWVVNTVPAYAKKVKHAIGGLVISWVPANATTPTSSPVTPKPAAPTVLLSLSGSGIENSAPFLVTESQLTVTYSYDCAAFGGTGNFIADLLTGNQDSLGSDDQSIANALGAGGTVTTTIYPQNPGTDYHLAVNSECNWSVTVKS